MEPMTPIELMTPDGRTLTAWGYAGKRVAAHQAFYGPAPSAADGVLWRVSYGKLFLPLRELSEIEARDLARRLDALLERSALWEEMWLTLQPYLPPMVNRYPTHTPPDLLLAGDVLDYFLFYALKQWKLYTPPSWLGL